LTRPPPSLSSSTVMITLSIFYFVLIVQARPLCCDSSGETCNTTLAIPWTNGIALWFKSFFWVQKPGWASPMQKQGPQVKRGACLKCCTRGDLNWNFFAPLIFSAGEQWGFLLDHIQHQTWCLN
jgi:hypothetical protein